jgi:pantoate--beta-alanine ligase
MEIIRIPRIMQETSKRALLRGRTIGFVPTMGALHEGHMSLIRACRQENDITVVSIFVNPTQFGPHEDFEKYPRDPEGDINKLTDAGVDTLYLPDTASMYPEGFRTSVVVNGLSDKLCGAFRPGHFSGVATVVTKLLNIVMPTRAYFGQKDYQQSLIIKRLVSDLNIPVEIVTCPTVREHDGLAMSSRNQYLNPDERKAATAIYKCLSSAAEKIKSGEKNAVRIKELMNEILSSEPLIKEIQYASAYDPETLDELQRIDSKVLLAVAVKIGQTRLIDNILLEETGS